MCMYNSNEFNFIQLVTSVDEVESTWKASSDLNMRSITEYMYILELHKHCRTMLYGVLIIQQVQKNRLAQKITTELMIFHRS